MDYSHILSLRKGPPRRQRELASAKFSQKLETIVSSKIPYISIAIIVLFFLLYGFIFAVSEPVGDDVLSHFNRGLNLYLDDEPNSFGYRITSFRQVFGAMKVFYLKWSGRMTGYFFVFSGSLMPRLLRAVLAVTVYILNILLALRLVYGTIKKVLCHPIAFEVLFLATYWFKPGSSYSKMWTMVGVYGIPLLLCLLYYNLARSDGKWRAYGPALILFQLLGILTGLSNEISGAILISMLGIDWLVRVLSKKDRWTSLFWHTGLGIGYLLCFFAPGNFHRMKQSHDAAIYTKPLSERIWTSYITHQSVLKFNTPVLWYKFNFPILWYMLILLLLIALISLLLECGSCGILKTGKRFLLRNFPFLAGGAISILAWGCVSHAPEYGLDFFICIFYIILFRTINVELILENIKSFHWKSTPQIVSTLVAVVLCALFLRAQWGWLKSYTFEALHRQILISAAVKDGRYIENGNEVKIPAYSAVASKHPLVPLHVLNRQSTFDSDLYIAYWGVHIIIVP